MTAIILAALFGLLYAFASWNSWARLTDLLLRRASPRTALLVFPQRFILWTLGIFFLVLNYRDVRALLAMVAGYLFGLILLLLAQRSRAKSAPVSYNHGDNLKAVPTVDDSR